MFASCQGEDRHDSISYESYWSKVKSNNDKIWKKQREKDSIDWRNDHEKQLEVYERSNTYSFQDSVSFDNTEDVNVLISVYQDKLEELSNRSLINKWNDKIHDFVGLIVDSLNSSFPTRIYILDSLQNAQVKWRKDRLEDVHVWYEGRNCLDEKQNKKWYSKYESQRRKNIAERDAKLREYNVEWKDKIIEWSEIASETYLNVKKNNYSYVYDDSIDNIARTIVLDFQDKCIDGFSSEVKKHFDKFAANDNWYDSYVEKEALWYKKWNEGRIEKIRLDAYNRQLCDDTLSLFRRQLEMQFDKETSMKAIMMRKGEVGRKNYDCPYYYVVDSNTWVIVTLNERDDSVKAYPAGTIFHMDYVESGFHKNRLRIHGGKVSKYTLHQEPNPHYGKRSMSEFGVQIFILLFCFGVGMRFAYNKTQKKFRDYWENITGVPNSYGMKKMFVFNKQPYLLSILLTLYVGVGFLFAIGVSYVIGSFFDGLNLEFMFMYVSYHYGIWLMLFVFFPVVVTGFMALFGIGFASLIIVFERFETYKYNRNMRCPNQECNAKTEPAIYYSKQYPLHVPLHPGVYGIFHITHPITKQKMPTMISNGRLKLKRKCPHCGIMIDTDGNVIDKHMVFVGSPAAGKTTLMVRLLGMMIKQNPSVAKIVGKIDSDIKDAIDSYVNEGIHKIVDKTYVAKQKRSVLLRIDRPTIPYQIYFNDVAGELFKADQAADNKLNFLANVQSIVLLVDPTTIDFRNLDISDSFKDWIGGKCSQNRNSTNDFGEVCDRLLNHISGDRFSRTNLQLNVVLVKADLGYIGSTPELCTQEEIRRFVLDDMGLHIINEFENRKEISKVSYLTVSAMESDESKSNISCLIKKITEDLDVKM